ncbi:MAG TPA: PPC domain-containing protein [Gemmatimonadales bacterium]|nr:PPC domain-containing protein [Gemmatimonadales bacterium]
MHAVRSTALLVLLATACGGKTHTGPEPDLESIAVTGAPPASAEVASTVTASFLVLHGPAGAVTIPKSGEAVTLTVVSGGGLIAGGASTVVTTGANGIASASWQLGAAAGSDVLRGSINGSQSADLTVTAVVTPVAHLTLLTPPSPGPQSGIPFFQQPVVQLTAANGSAVAQAGVPVTVTVASGAGTLGTATPAPGDGTAHLAALVVNTDVSGQARFSDLMLTGSGTVTLQFSAPGYAAASTPALSLNGSPVIFALNNGNEAGPFGSTAGSQAYASFTAPAGSTDFRVGLYNGTGTVHLYARRGNYPTATSFDCASLLTGTSQLCASSASPAGQWFLLAHGVTDYQNVLVRAVAYGPSCARTTMTIGNAVSGSLTPGTDCAVPANQGARDRYSLAPLSQQALIFNLASSNTVVIELKSQLSSRTKITSPPGGGVSIPFLLAPGDHDVEVADGTAGLLGGQSYTLTATTASANLASCAPVGMYETGVVANLLLAATDCTGIAPVTRSDRFYTWALTGQTLVATMSSGAFDPFLRVLAGQALGTATVLATDDNGGGGTSARVSYTNLGPPSDFTIEATTTLAGGLGAYTLSLDLAPPVYNLPELTPSLRTAATVHRLPFTVHR